MAARQDVEKVHSIVLGILLCSLASARFLHQNPPGLAGFGFAKASSRRQAVF